MLLFSPEPKQQPPPSWQPVSPYAILLSWGPPDQPNGIINRYTVIRNGTRVNSGIFGDSWDGKDYRKMKCVVCTFIKTATAVVRHRDLHSKQLCQCFLWKDFFWYKVINQKFLMWEFCVRHSCSVLCDLLFSWRPIRVENLEEKSAFRYSAFT